MTRLQVFKPTGSEWYPSYKLPPPIGSLVEVSLLELHTGMWRVCAWGADDFGMERDFPTYQKTEATELFLKILGWKTVDVPDLEAEGFVYA